MVVAVVGVAVAVARRDGQKSERGGCPRHERRKCRTRRHFGRLETFRETRCFLWSGCVPGESCRLRRWSGQQRCTARRLLRSESWENAVVVVSIANFDS